MNIKDDTWITKAHIAEMRMKFERYAENEWRSDYMAKTVLLDLLYFMGTSINEDEFFAAQGFDKFKTLLREVLA